MKESQIIQFSIYIIVISQIILFNLCSAGSNPLKFKELKQIPSQKVDLTNTIKPLVRDAVGNICSTIKDSIPSVCKVYVCDEANIGIGCEVVFFTYSFEADIDLHLCDQPPFTNFTFYVPTLQVNYQITVQGSTTFQIPGFDIKFPTGTARTIFFSTIFFENINFLSSFILYKSIRCFCCS